MSMDDDSGVRLLERDLRKLAKPQERDEQLRRALRGQLATRSHPRRRRRRSMRVAFGTAVVSVAAAAIAIVALVGTDGSGGPATADAAIIRHALIAVSSPANEILHVKVVGVQNGMAIAGESWQQTSAPYASRYMKGEIGHQGEFSDNGTTSFQYDAPTNTIHSQRDVSRATFTNPISQIRQELASGQAQLVGTVVIDGAALYKIDLPNGLVGYFDERRSRPRYLDNPQSDGTVLRMRVAAYEYLPMTKSNRALLSVTAQHPYARVDTNPNGAAGT
jgi:hypothetical protein